MHVVLCMISYTGDANCEKLEHVLLMAEILAAFAYGTDSLCSFLFA